MPVIYKDKALVPAPFVNITTNKDYGEDGTLLKTSFVVTLNGKLFSYMGGLMASGTEGREPDLAVTPLQRQNKIQEKQALLLEHFKQEEGKTDEDPGWIEIDGWENASSIIKFKPRIKSIDFKEGSWTDYVEYTIQLETDTMKIGSSTIGEPQNETELEKQVQESWQVDQSDESGRSFKLTHTLSVGSKRFYDTTEWKEAYDQCKKAIKKKLKGKVSEITDLGPEKNENLDTYFQGNLFGANAKLYDYNVSLTSDEGTGKVNASETWTLYDTENTASPIGTAPAIEEYSIEASNSGESFFTAKISGTIKGLKTTDANSRYTNALAKWASVKPEVLNRIKVYYPAIPGSDVDRASTSSSVGTSFNNGVITYSYEYQERVLPPGFIVEDYISFDFNIARTNPVDIGAPRQYAVIPVLGRAAGPVVQPLNSAPERGVTVTLNFVRKQPNRYTVPDINQIYSLMQAAVGINTLTTFEDAFNYTSGKYTATAKYIIAI